jgi:hypothetical protein
VTTLTEKPAARPKTSSSVVGELRHAITLLRSDAPLAYAHRKRLADVLQQYVDLEQAYLDARRNPRPAPKPQPGDAAHLAQQIAAALVPDAPRKSAAPAAKKATS